MASQKEMRSSPVDPPSGFFKVILDNSLKAKKMMIPKKFVRNHSDVFLDDVNLIVPNGHSWKVGLKKLNNEIYYFGRNWNDFVEHYSIRKEHFLVFGYKGLSTFEIRMFNPSGCEYHYPAIATTQEPQTNHGYSVDPEDAIGAPAPFSLKKRTTKKRECSKMPAASEKNQETRKRRESVSSPERPIQKKLNTAKQTEAEAEADDAKNIIGDVGFGKTNPRNERAIRACRNFKTKFPCFNIMMRDYHLNHNFVNLPSKFGGEFLKEVVDYIKLQVSDGREWSVKVNKRSARSRQRKYDRFTLGDGWAAFQRENHLKNGDICVIEFRKKNAWKVSIFRD